MVAEADRPLVWRACLVDDAARACRSARHAKLVSTSRRPCGLLLRGLGLLGAAGATQGAAAARFAGQRAGFLSVAVRDGIQLGRRPDGDAAAILSARALVCGIHALATAADYDADKAAGHRTFAVAFGRRAAAAFAFATFAVACCVGDYQGVAVRVFIAWSACWRRWWRRSCRAIGRSPRRA